MASSPLAHVLVPTPPQTATRTATSTTETAELDTSIGGRFRFVAKTEDAYLTFGPTGSVTTPTTSNGLHVPAGTYQDFNVPIGWKFRVIAGGNGFLCWYGMAI